MRADEKLALRALRKNGIDNKIVVARDGAEALDYLFKTGAYADSDDWSMPVLILLDLNLPKISGLDVLRQLRGDNRTQNLAVVILSTSDEDKDIISSYNLGPNSYVRKPVIFGEFVEAVRPRPYRRSDGPPFL